MEPTVLDADLPEPLRPGLYWPTRRGAYVLVHRDLHPHERRSVVAHELAHHARGGGIDRAWMPPDWQAVVAREEYRTDRDAAARLIPPDVLSAWVEGHLADIEVGIGPDDVAATFGVTRRIAEAALDNMNRWERQRGRGTT